MATRNPAEAAANARCSRCSAPFYCGMETGVENCWCATLPPVEPVPGRGCACRACLEAALARSKDIAR